MIGLILSALLTAQAPEPAIDKLSPAGRAAFEAYMQAEISRTDSMVQTIPAFVEAERRDDPAVIAAARARFAVERAGRRDRRQAFLKSLAPVDRAILEGSLLFPDE